MEIVLFVVVVVVVAILGVGIGMLVAPRISRAMDPPDEDDGDGTP
jgi:uncharacterized protein YneF (UPF0154 family)